MIRFAHAAAATAMVALLAACATPAATPPGAAAAPASSATAPATAPGPITGLDGVYRPQGGAATGNAQCGTTRFGYPIRVSGGIASMQTVSQGMLQGTVAPDGSLLVEHGVAVLQGKFAPGAFNGTFNVGRCSFTLAYRK